MHQTASLWTLKLIRRSSCVRPPIIVDGDKFLLRPVGSFQTKSCYHISALVNNWELFGPRHRGF